VIDLRQEQHQNTFASIRVNSDFLSNKIDESEVQYKKYDVQKM
jgi:hypothetical protein